MNKKSIIKISAVAITVVILLFLSLYIYPSLRIATGYAAKYTCSYTFLSGLEYEKIQRSFNFFPVDKVRCDIDMQDKVVTASLFGMAERKAFFYQRGSTCGCVLDSVGNINAALEKNFPAEVVTDTNQSIFDSIPDSLSHKIDSQKLNKVLSAALDSNPSILAITVAYKDYLVSDKYAEGVTKDTRLLGWSMTKTVLNALYGILEKNGKINLEENCCLPEWKNDERREITLNNLLQMNSGLQWNEEYSMKTDVTQMLYLEPDVSSYAMQMPGAKKPGDEWRYSSGTTNILSRILRLKLAEQYLSFPYDSLFNVIGMSSAVVELDNSGNYIYSSYGWATARDWTKFGLLYLNKGNWFGRQVFTPQWAEYSVAPANSSDNGYGAQVWLNASDKKLPAVPGDAFFANGYGGQKILVIPSKQMVIVVLSGRQKDFDFNSFYAEVFSCFL